MEKIRVFLLDKYGDIQYGLNWGQRINREPNQAYLQLEKEIYDSSFFPKKGTYFLVNTDDGKEFAMNRAQKTDDGTALQTPENNSILGLYIRNRLGVADGEEIMKKSILDYGRYDMVFTKIDDRHYKLNFEKNWKDDNLCFVFQTYLITQRVDIPYDTIVQFVREVKDNNINRAKNIYEEFINSDYYKSHYMLLNSRNKNINTEQISSDYRQYITAIKTKPFMLLAGISGTGKSRIVRELARACWDEGTADYEAHKPSNFEMVQVKPNWHDSSELLGYVSRVSGTPEFVAGPFLKFVVKAWEHKDTPYFFCLDEMNLAPVEQYFAEYLSVIESRKATGDGTDKKLVTDPIIENVAEQWYYDLVCRLTVDEELQNQFKLNGISLPENLIVVGTVNMDETTFSFSRKVLDRAMTIEMNDVDLTGGLSNRYETIGKLEKDNLIGTAAEGVDVYEANESDCDEVIKYLIAVNDKLEGTPFKIAYRTRNEFLLYMVNNLPYGQDSHHGRVIARALDEITCMKILPRIEGDESKVPVSLLKGLQSVIKDNLEKLGECTFTSHKNEAGVDQDVRYSQSLAKLDEMIRRLDSGYTSFWS